ncbi:MAG TPA: hypothetical protein VMX96_07520 [Dehalococcoidia bacterium]|nr:hypothetical protein [Dehalococcoidia bacterium]
MLDEYVGLTAVEQGAILSQRYWAPDMNPSIAFMGNHDPTGYYMAIEMGGRLYFVG